MKPLMSFDLSDLKSRGLAANSEKNIWFVNTGYTANMFTVRNTDFDCHPISTYFHCTFDPCAKEVTEKVHLKLVYLYCTIVQFTSVFSFLLRLSFHHRTSYFDHLSIICFSLYYTTKGRALNTGLDNYTAILYRE